MYPNTYIQPSLFSMIKGIKWGSVLDGTQKTLGVINQAIPVIYQVKPVVSNMRSMFKIANAIATPDVSTNSNNQTNQVNNQTNQSDNINNNNNIYTTKPVFYI